MNNALDTSHLGYNNSLLSGLLFKLLQKPVGPELHALHTPSLPHTSPTGSMINTASITRICSSPSRLHHTTVPLCPPSPLHALPCSLTLHLHAPPAHVSSMGSRAHLCNFLFRKPVRKWTLSPPSYPIWTPTFPG